MPLNIPFLRGKASPSENTVGEPIDHAITTSSSEKENAKSTGIEISDVEANRRLDLYHRTHKWDPNLGDDTLDEVATATALNDSNAQSKIIDRVIDNSPYPEVRAAVRNYDEELPASTFRAWAIGMLLTTIGSGLNSLFSLRAPAIIITSVVALLVSYPIGVAWAKIIPSRTFNTFGLKWNTNPGPFNVKEHVLIVVMANASFGNGVAYFTDTIQALKAFYHTDYGWGFYVCLALSTQIVGFGIAGIVRKVLVEPASMIWPQDLVSATFIYTLHDKSATNPAETNGWKIGRYRYFLYVFLGSFFWYWFPGVIAPCLSVFAIVTFIKPKNVILNQLFGGWTGLSLIPITFDWTQVTGNTLIGTIGLFIFVTCGLHYSNHWYAQYLPISDSTTYDNMAKPYNVSRILSPDFTLDEEKYKAYSPLFLSTTFALTYGLSFASIAAVVTHTALFHGQHIWTVIRDSRGELDDVHTRMMRKYKNAPWWWYITLLAVCVALCLVTALAWPTHLTWWALLLALLISLVMTIPIGVVQATTNIQLGLNVFTEYIIGYMLPGRPLAMMLFKTYGYITMVQALSFVQDLKLGHYMKVPPRSLFWGQLVATIWSCIVQLCVQIWALDNIADICQPHQSNRFTCPQGRVFFGASVIWGVIGPARMFSGNALYSSLQYFWIVGALSPLLFYALARIFPRSNARFLSAPVIFGSVLYIPPATPLNYFAWCMVGFVFQKYIRNRFRGWWMRFNYITSASLDAGLAISTIVVIAAINLTGSKFPSWWGNTGSMETLDNLGEAIRQPLAKGETFGPATW
ncbi:OPT peptide transporter Mtd1, putative [Trichophyton benhamiae CBS 112371]|uniref:OPT peptide transporter Mtd1, putative n=1 Tax=Arthroderma benhamiae (strain ATCC MYA-4681 / CBS 112371) TaxID=663331 RepID=D4B1Q4_ARTBC|nr:OPT peptide transporter Mtd1, putative [Trichophyton benhamiae CBS 112371]EFE30686.1 OPT peptide transporter Mtd1, putative [Trichophyton benhamiae CBS 112371]